MDGPPDVVDWRAFGPLLQDAQDRLRRVEARLEKLENQLDFLKEGINLIHEDQLTTRAEVRMVSNRLKVVETTVREIDAKLDLILKHLGL